MTRRVVITGLGVVSPAGIGSEAFWAGLLDGHAWGSRVVEGFDVARWVENPKEARRLDRTTHLCIAASDLALDDAGSPDLDPERTGVIVSSQGGVAVLEEQVAVFREKGAKRISPFLIPAHMANAPAGHVSMRHGFQGPCESDSIACAGGTAAIGRAAATIRRGTCDAMLAGGGDNGQITPIGMAGFDRTGSASASERCRPFDAERDGFFCAEGAGIVLLEELEHARRRGARIYAEVLAYANTSDAHHITTPDPDGTATQEMLRQVLHRAGLAPTDIGYVNAHGTGTQLNDLTEARALVAVWEGATPTVVGTKGAHGHPINGCGSTEAAVVALTMAHELITPSVGHTRLADDLPPIDVVPGGEPRPWTPRPAITQNLAFGGHNAALVLAPVE